MAIEEIIVMDGLILMRKELEKEKSMGITYSITWFFLTLIESQNGAGAKEVIMKSKLIVKKILGNWKLSLDFMM